MYRTNTANLAERIMENNNSGETRSPDDTREPELSVNDVLVLKEKHFHETNVCIVTGASTGIGRATAFAAAVNGLTVIGLDINEEQGEKTRSLIERAGGRFFFIPSDLTRDQDIESAVTEASGHGNIKYLVNIAGVQHIDAIEDFPMEKYDFMQRLMLRAPFYLSRLTIPYMKKSEDKTGVIANMASVHAHITTVKKSVYNITKFGLRALSQSISAEGEGRIRSFTISTGFVKTPLALNQIPAQAEKRNMTPEQVVREVMMAKSRVKTMMSPIEVANLFIFGFSRNANYLVGGDLLFDGGMVLTY